MEPARTIVTKLGGPTAVAKYVGVDRTRVSNWMRPKDAGGTGGTIPMRHIPKLLQMAAGKGIEIEPGDFIPKLVEAH